MLLHDWSLRPFGSGMLCLAPDSGAGGGAGGGDGGDGGGGGGGGGKVYTEEEFTKAVAEQVNAQVEASMKRWRKGLQKDKETLQQENAKLQRAVEELRAELEHQSAGGDGDDRYAPAKVEAMVAKHAKELDQLKQQLKEAEERATEADMRTKETIRDKMLTAALVEAQCQDMKAGERYFNPDIHWDDSENSWLMTSPDGNPCSIEHGVKNFLPDYLKPASQRVGGSNSTPAMRRLESQRKELAGEEERFCKLRDVAMRTHKTADIDAAEAQRIVVAKMRREIEEAAK